jgi:lipopolysaccharide transport system ATP-binding protein
MNQSVAIAVQNLTKRYKLYKDPIDRLKEALNPFGKSYHKNFNALDGVSFEIKKGETVGIVGRNGCGKSTLLKLITGVLTPTHGSICVQGKISAILELGAGFNPELNGLENIYLNASINGMSKEETDQRIHEIVEFSELGDFIHQPIKTYSSGMNARLAFGLAINIEPDLLIIDEALSVGDTAFQRKCFAKMEQIRKSGATILFVSHSEASIVNLCNRAIWLSNGKKVIDGEPKHVTSLYMKNSNKDIIDSSKVAKEFQELQKATHQKHTQTIIPGKIEKPKTETSIKEFYTPSLKPKSTLYYEEKGAKILNVKVTTLENKKINVLRHTNKYLFSLDVDFHKIHEDVNFGIAIKDMKGSLIAGASYELLKHKKLDSVKDSRYKIDFLFECLLVEGIFVIDAVVHSEWSTNKNILNRVNDAYIFRVLKTEDMHLNHGKISLFKKCTVCEY